MSVADAESATAGSVDIVWRRRRLNDRKSRQTRLRAFLVKGKTNAEEVIKGVLSSQDGRSRVVGVQVERVEQRLHDLFTGGVPLVEIEHLKVVPYRAGVVLGCGSDEVRGKLQTSQRKRGTGLLQHCECSVQVGKDGPCQL